MTEPKHCGIYPDNSKVQPEMSRQKLPKRFPYFASRVRLIGQSTLTDQSVAQQCEPAVHGTGRQARTVTSTFNLPCGSRRKRPAASIQRRSSTASAARSQREALDGPRPPATNVPELRWRSRWVRRDVGRVGISRGSVDTPYVEFLNVLCIEARKRLRRPRVGVCSPSRLCQWKPQQGHGK